MERIANVAAVTRAFHLAAKGKRFSEPVKRFRRSFDEEISAIVKELCAGSWSPGEYKRFMVCDPKPRVIHAASFRDRVVHHALMHVAGPVLERSASAHSCACLRGRGNPAAVRLAMAAARRYRYHLKLDVRRYFDSIPHGILVGLLHGRFKDARLLVLFERIIDSFQTDPGKGLPIGSLTSQYFANFFLDGMDHWLSGLDGVAAAVRYMDDIVLWHDDPTALAEVHERLVAWLEGNRGLVLKDARGPRPCAEGLPFLGYRILPGRLLLARASRRRFAARLHGYYDDFATGRLTIGQLQRRTDALLAFTQPSCCHEWRGRIVSWNLRYE